MANRLADQMGVAVLANNAKGHVGSANRIGEVLSHSTRGYFYKPRKTRLIRCAYVKHSRSPGFDKALNMAQKTLSSPRRDSDVWWF